MSPDQHHAIRSELSITAVSIPLESALECLDRTLRSTRSYEEVTYDPEKVMIVHREVWCNYGNGASYFCEFEIFTAGGSNAITYSRHFDLLHYDINNFLYDQMPMAGLYIDGAWGKSAFSRNLGQFYVDGSGSVTKYFRSELMPVLKYENSYRFSFDERGLHAEAIRKDFEYGWFAGQILEVVSATDDRMVLISSLSDQTVDELHLFDDLPCTPIGIRTTWIRIENPPETLLNAIPAEEWDPSGSEKGTE